MELTIDYCTDCGHSDKAIKTAEAAAQNYEEEFDQIVLVPADDGVFRVSIEGHIIFDIDEDSFEVGKIMERIDERLEEE
ncbi:MAG: Rdx family protein [Candidatus Nanohaloarchaea archaeon]